MTASRDETYDNIDPHSGQLTADALARRATITAEVVASDPEFTGSWADALAAYMALNEPADPEPGQAQPAKLF